MAFVGRSILGRILLLACLLYACLGSGCGLRGWELLRRLEQQEKEQGWRILADNTDLCLVDIRTKSLITVYEERHDLRYEHMSGGSFSPDGTKITFTHRNALVVFDLVQRREDVLLEMRHLEGARWSPTGEVIAFQGGPDHRGIYNLYFFRLRDKKVSLVVEQEIGPGGSQFAWRRDGKGLVFEDLKRNIWMLDLDTRQRQRLGNGHFPSWSPDGRYIAYGTEQEDFLYDLTTGQKKTIFAGEEVLGALVWSPDSRYVVYAKPRFLPRLFGKISGSLWVTDLQTGTTVPLYSEGPNIGPVDWVAGVPASVGN